MQICNPRIGDCIRPSGPFEALEEGGPSDDEPLSEGLAVGGPGSHAMLQTLSGTPRTRGTRRPARYPTKNKAKR